MPLKYLFDCENYPQNFHHRPSSEALTFKWKMCFSEEPYVKFYFD